ncbi:MAG: DUF1295 domain-containing protein [Saprospiraceae bacterium]|nr:DUF1295 domain-containing protein [Saprospiraceae bacterium]
MSLSRELQQQGDFLFRHRSYLPIVLIPLAMAAMVSSVKIHPEWYGHHYITLPEIACLFLSLAGLLVRIITVGFTPANTSGRNTAGQLADTLNTSGMYSVVRHPLYLGNYLMWAGIAALTGNALFVLAFTLGYIIYYERIMYAEEHFLAGKFGDTFQAWASRVPLFIPAPGQWVKNDLTFSWKKVLRKEKNGLLAIFVMIALFQLWSDFIQDQMIHLPHSWCLLAIAVTGLAYLVLKIMKYQTRWLDEEGR